MVSDETFFAWLDGELEPAEAARVKAAVDADPRLSAMAREHRTMLSSISGAFDTLLDAPVPDPILEAARIPQLADVIDLGEAKKRREARRWAWVAQWGSMAASLVMGIFVGTALQHQHEGGPVEMQGGAIYAAASLGHALETELASNPSRDVRVGMTFRDHGGDICRSFTSAASSGVACRDNSGWKLRGLFAAPPGQSSDFRMASSMDPALGTLVDSMISGEPFDAAQEQAARKRRWK